MNIIIPCFFILGYENIDSIIIEFKSLIKLISSINKIRPTFLLAFNEELLDY